MKKFKSYRHYFHNMELFYGSEIVCVTGVGIYHINREDSGEQGDAEHNVAEFDKVVVAEHKWLDSRVKANLTKQDVQTLQGLIKDKFNEDFELCESLAWDVELNSDDTEF